MPVPRDQRDGQRRHAVCPGDTGRCSHIHGCHRQHHAHLRNHAFLHQAGTLALSPAYDAAPTAEFTGTRHLALWIGGQSLLAVVTRRHLLRELASWGMAPDSAADVIDTTLDNLADAYDQAARLIPEVSPAIVAACQSRTERLRRTASDHAAG